MADKQLGIIATLDGLDEILTDLSSLVELLGQLPETTTLSINTQGLDQAASDSDNVEVSLQQVGEAAAVSNTNIDEMGQSIRESSEALGGFNSGAWDEIETGAGNASKAIEEVNTQAEDLSYTMTNSETGETFTFIANDIDKANDSLTDFNSELSGINVSAFNDIATDAQESSVNIQQIGEAAGMAGVDLSSLDVSAKEVSDSVKSIDSSNVQGLSTAGRDASASLSDTANSTNALETAANALIAVGLGAWLADATNASGNWANSINLMAITLGGSVDTADAIQAQYSGAINEMADSTGRSTLTIRSYISLMANAGVSSADVLESSFEGIAATSYRTGSSIETIENAFKRVVSTGSIGSRQLVSMGLTTSDVYKATGMSVEELSASLATMDETQRAAMLSTVLNSKNSENSLIAYKVSWEHTLDVLNRAWNALSRIAGGFVLPIITPIIDATTDALISLADAVKTIPEPIQNLIGVIILLGAGLVSWYTLVAPLVSILGTALAPILSTVSALITTLTIDTVAVGEAAAFAGAGMAEGAIGMEAVGASAGILEVALGPIGWIILGITAAVLAGLYVWENYKTQILNFASAIQGGNWGSAAEQIVSSFSYVGSAIYSSLVNAGQQIWTFFANLPATIGNTATSWLNTGRNLFLYLIKGLTSLTSYLSTILTEMVNEMATDGGTEQAGVNAGQNTGKGIINGIKQWLITNGPLLKQTFVLLFQQLMPLIGQLILQLSAIAVIWFIQTAQRIGVSFLTALMTFFNQLPGLVLASLMNTLMQIAYWTGFLIGYSISAGSQFVLNFISYLLQLPGQLWSILMNALGAVSSFASQSPSMMASAGWGMVNGLASSISSLPGVVWNELMNIYHAITNAGGSLYSAAVSLGQQIYQGLMAGLEKKSPGIMYKAVVEELGFMDDALSDNNLGSTSEALGKDIASAFISSADLKSALPDISGVNLSTVSTSNSNSTSKQQVEVTVKEEHTFKFEDVPENIDTDGMEAMFRDYLKSRDGKSVLDSVLRDIQYEYLEKTGG